MLAATNEFDLTIQLVVTFGAIIVAAIPVLISQQRLHRKQDELYQHVNNVEEGERVPGRGRTLGSVVRDLDRKVEQGFIHENEVHEAIKATIRELDSLVRIREDET